MPGLREALICVDKEKVARSVELSLWEVRDSQINLNSKTARITLAAKITQRIIEDSQEEPESREYRY